MGFEKMLNEKRERERKGRKRGGVVSRIRWMGARGKAKKKKKTRELEQKQRAEGEALGSRSRRRERRSSCSLEQTRLPPRKGRKTRSGPRRGRNSLSLSLGPIALFLLFVPAGYIPLLFFARRGLTVCTRDAATPQECPTSPPRAYLYNLLYLGPTVASSILSS